MNSVAASTHDNHGRHLRASFAGAGNDYGLRRRQNVGFVRQAIRKANSPNVLSEAYSLVCFLFRPVSSLTGAGNVQLFTVLGHGAPRDVEPFGFQQTHDFHVTVGFGFILGID